MSALLYAAYFITTAALLCYSVQGLVLLLIHAASRSRLREENEDIAARAESPECFV